MVAGLLGLGCTVAPRAGETAAEGEAGARAAVVHGGYAYLCDNPAEYPGYDPAKLWDEGLRALGFAAARLRSGDVGDWGGRIGQYDLILLTNMYAHSADVRWEDMGPKLAAWVRNGGVLVVEGARVPHSPVDWLSAVNESWRLGASGCLCGWPDWVEPGLLEPHRLVDGYEGDAFYVQGVGAGYDGFGLAGLPDYATAGLTVPSNGEVLAKNRDGRATIWTDALGEGRVFVTGYFKGYVLDEFLLEDLLAWHCRRRGGAYVPRLKEEPSIAERVAGVPLSGKTSPIRVGFSEHGVMQIDGKPFFPFGFYGVQDRSLTVLAEKGFNFTWSGNRSAWSHGLRSTQQATWDNGELASWIGERIADPARVCWELFEEPNHGVWDNTNYMRYRNALVGKLDPCRPTMLMCNTAAQFESHYQMCDIAALDYYPITGSTSPLTGLASTLGAINEVTRGKPVWLVAQAFGQGNTWALPNPEQLRAQMYVGLAAGVKGIAWFVLYDPESMAPPSPVKGLRLKDGAFREPQWSALCALADEFGAMRPYLVGRDDGVAVSVVTPVSGVCSRCFTRNAGPQHMLVIANALADPQQATVALPFTPAKYTALFDSPGVEVADKRITVSLKGYERAVYTLAE